MTTTSNGSVNEAVCNVCGGTQWVASDRIQRSKPCPACNADYFDKPQPDPGVAESGLGVGEHKPGTCWDCGKKRDHTWHAGPWKAGYSHIYRATQPTDAPPSPPDRAPRPVPDQVLTPLSAEAVWGRAQVEAREFIEEARRDGQPVTAFSANDYALGWADGFAAALAGVPRHEDWVTAFLAEHDARAVNNEWHPAILPAYHRAQTEGVEWLPESAESFDAVVAWTLRNLGALAGVPKEAVE